MTHNPNTFWKAARKHFVGQQNNQISRYNIFGTELRHFIYKSQTQWMDFFQWNMAAAKLKSTESIQSCLHMRLILFVVLFLFEFFYLWKKTLVKMDFNTKRRYLFKVYSATHCALWLDRVVSRSKLLHVFVAVETFTARKEPVEFSRSVMQYFASTNNMETHGIDFWK